MSSKSREESETELFRLEMRQNLSTRTLGVRPGNIVVAVQDPGNLTHLEKVLAENNPSETDVVVLSVNADMPDPEPDNQVSPEEVVKLCQIKVFSKAVYLAEKTGKPASLVAVAGKDPFEMVLLAAHRLRSSVVVMSLSEKGDAEEQVRQIGKAWEELPRPRPDLRVEIVPDGDEAPWKLDLGQHLSLPSSGDQDLAHRLLRRLTDGDKEINLHQEDVFAIALRHLEEDLQSKDTGVLEGIRREVQFRGASRAWRSE